jgi:hypothetical protein
MSKYGDLHADIYSIFGSPTWAAESIGTYPDNFVGTNVGNEYIRVSIIASGRSRANPLKSASGQLIIDIFTLAGAGTKRMAFIADKLDAYLVGKSVATTSGGTTQLMESSLASQGIDKANPALYRASYSIPFNYFGI